MNTLNYIGCKNKLSSTLLDIFNKNIPDLSKYEFCDLFAGTGIVGYNFLGKVKKVVSNDLEYYSFVINKAVLECSFSQKLENIINNLEKSIGKEGLIYENYSKERMFFSKENACKGDSIRQEIEKMYVNKEINTNEYYFLIASLLVSIDKVANTTSVYGAYLKEYKKTALKTFKLESIHRHTHTYLDNKVFNQLAEDVVKENVFDIVYMDPPYNERQYAANYGPLNYIAHYNKNIEVRGKTGLLKDYNKSSFCSKVNVKKAFTEMIKTMKAKYIVLSYNNEGLMDIDFIKNTLLEKGKVILYKIKYNKFKAQQKVKEKYVEEFVWFVKVGEEKIFEEY